MTLRELLALAIGKCDLDAQVLVPDMSVRGRPLTNQIQILDAALEVDAETLELKPADRTSKMVVLAAK